MKIGNFTLEPDTLQVLIIAGVATGAIMTLTGFGMLANHWRMQAEPDRAAVSYEPTAGAGHAEGSGAH